MFNPLELIGIGKTLKNFAGELQTVRAEQETLLQRREEIKYAPAHRSEVLQALEGWVQRSQGRYSEHLQHAIGWLRTAPPEQLADPVKVDGHFRMRAFTAGGPQVHSTDVDLMIAGLFGDLLMSALRARLDALSQVPSEGLPIAQRATEIETINARLLKLQELEKKLVDTAKQAGLSVE